jgi:hypothetical protein
MISLANFMLIQLNRYIAVKAKVSSCVRNFLYISKINLVSHSLSQTDYDMTRSEVNSQFVTIFSHPYLEITLGTQQWSFEKCCCF